MNTTFEPSVEIGTVRPASSAFSLHRYNRLSNVLAALKLRQPDAGFVGTPAPTPTEIQPSRPAAPHYLSMR